MRIENSPDYEARMEASAIEEKKELADLDHALKKSITAWIAAGSGWRSMQSCPLKALEKQYDIDGVIMVRDAAKFALVNVTERFGRPVFYKENTEIVYKDGVMHFIGGEEDPRTDLPKWWWEYELKDVLEDTYEYGETYHGAPIDFVPTTWTFLPNVAPEQEIIK